MIEKKAILGHSIARIDSFLDLDTTSFSFLVSFLTTSLSPKTLADLS